MKLFILMTAKNVMKHFPVLSMCIIVGVLLVGTQMVQGQPKTSEEKIQNAMSAAPASISRDATIMDYPAREGDGPTELRKGTNAWFCFPDNPGSPSNDPICVDKVWLDFFQAYMTQTEPKVTAPGISYMLQGGSDSSNSDPFAPPPSNTEDWIISPPHLMVIIPGKLDPTVFSTDFNSGGPWIMWEGTPYEHLMVPVK